MEADIWAKFEAVEAKIFNLFSKGVLWTEFQVLLLEGTPATTGEAWKWGLQGCILVA